MKEKNFDQMSDSEKDLSILLAYFTLLNKKRIKKIKEKLKKNRDRLKQLNTAEKEIISLFNMRLRKEISYGAFLSSLCIMEHREEIK